MNAEQPILSKIRAFRSRIRVCLILRGLAAVALVVAGLACVSLVLDYTQRLGLGGRIFSLVVGVAVILVAAHRVLFAKLAQPMDDERVALTVEDRFPELRDRLISALQFARIVESGADGGSGRSVALMSSVTAEAAAAVAPLRLGRTLAVGRVVRAVAFAAAAWGVLALCAGLQPAAARIWFLRNVALQNVAWPQRTELSVTYRKVVPRGDALTVSVEAGGRLIPSSVSIRYRFEESGRKGREKLARVGGRGEHRFETKFKNVVEPLRFRVSGGDAVTEWYEVRLVERPSVRRLQIQAVYPAYMRKPNAELRASESFLDVPAGTSLWVRVVPTKPLRAAHLVLDDGARTVDMIRAVDAPPDGAAAPEPWQTRGFWLSEADRAALARDAAEGKCADELWLAPLRVRRDSAAAVRLRDLDKLENRSPARFSIRIVPDRPPVVSLRTRGVGQMVVPEATVPIEIKATDDYGIKGMRLNHRLRMEDQARAEDEETIRFQLRYGGRELEHAMRWNLAGTGIVPGSVLVFYAEAADYKNVGEPNVARSEEISLRVVTADELLADLIRRQIDQRQDVVRVRDRQRDEVKIEIDAAARATAPLTPEQKTRLLAAEQTIRHSAEELKTVAIVCRQILMEMVNNKLGDDAERSKLRDAIVGPVQRLGAEWMPALADGLREAADAGTDPARRFGELAARNDRILKQLDGILANMLKMETYQRIVGAARKVEADQERLLEAIKEQHKKLIESILGGGG